MCSSKLLQAFQREVIQKGKDSTLPCNLPDKWLKILINNSERALNLASSTQDASDTEVHTALDKKLIKMAIEHILHTKYNKTLPIDALKPAQYRSYMEGYRMELALESITRVTDIAINAATIDTIFTNREVNIMHKH